MQGLLRQTSKTPFRPAELQHAACGPVARCGLQPLFSGMVSGQSEAENPKKPFILAPFKHHRPALCWTLFWSYKDRTYKDMKALILRNSVPDLVHLGHTGIKFGYAVLGGTTGWRREWRGTEWAWGRHWGQLSLSVGPRPPLWWNG